MAATRAARLLRLCRGVERSMNGSLIVEVASLGVVATSTLLGLAVMAGEKVKPARSSLASIQQVAYTAVSFPARVLFASTTRVGSERGYRL
jgi:hypothetical protein